MADIVVFAGPNGVGKTHISSALIRFGQNPGASPNVRMTIEATCDDERARWGKSTLDPQNGNDAGLLRTTLQRTQRRNQYKSSFLNFDSDRAIRNVASYIFGWDIGDPLLEEVSWDAALVPLSSRHDEVRHSLFRMVEGQKRQIAEEALARQCAGEASMPLAIPDILQPFKDAFWHLLAPKKLIEVSTRDQQIYFETEGVKLPIESLSSGEREVINIVFDFILRGPEDCVIVFDEPELHLHPELSYKLLQTLASAGKRNQFLFSTHSPEIISASLENTVVFVRQPQTDIDNQALVVNRDDQTHHALQALGQSIGVISLGKKLVLIEGEEASLDKLTYSAVLKNRFPEFVLVPAGGKDSIRSFADAYSNIVSRTIWGVRFYLLCDRDAANIIGSSAVMKNELNRITVLPRYHLENYFLDEQTYAACFQQIEAPDSWLRNAVEIKKRLLKIAAEAVPYAVALNVTAAIRAKVGNVSVMPRGAVEAKSPAALCQLMEAKLENELARVQVGLDRKLVNHLVTSEFERLSKAVEEDNPIWRADLPGRFILNKFASEADISVGRLKQLYLNNAEPEAAFQDIIAVFERFRSAS
ncbi:AAA family ATPase [Bradyrhizobium sp. 24]|uniref:ATP-binding protein n=1 Tax=unclassified Bradyrhizobium TaxID=2631580 RepID=UPI001FFADABA|nr:MULTISPECIES: ATP-binding protein [unclassified Bradyrhizobium]MCK1297606.1 AAA family ATPase [Bradyrhizobium sp. 37]MCK1381240.1 AAA family ATPase [Bradyrhizobium sp. 24]MCK1771010.1 AAA family ATPase [Bradyrhizobium sp. 134]